MGFLKNITIVIILYLIFVINVNSQNKYGLPYIKNFYDINSPALSNQVWDIVQTEDGLTYIATDTYVVEYDGFNFKNISPFYNTHFFSFAYQKETRNLFVGAKNNIYSIYLNKGKLEFIDIPLPIAINSTWKTYFYDNKVYFFINKTDVVVKDSTTLTVINRPIDFLITRGFKVENELYAISNKGIAKIEGDEINIISTQYKNIYEEDIRGIIKYNDTLLLLATRKGNLYLFDTNRDIISKFETEINDFLIQSNIYYITKIDNNNFVIGTYKKGIAIISNKGELIKNINKENGLLSNAIYCIYVDNFKNLWLGTGKGLSIVYWGNSIRTYDARNKLDEVISCFVIMKQKLLVATFAGIISTDLNTENQFFSVLFDNILYGNSLIYNDLNDVKYLILGNYKGITLLDENLNIIDSNNYCSIRKIIKSPVVPHRYYAVTSKELQIFTIIIKNNKLKIEVNKKFDNLLLNADNISFDNNNNLWVVLSKGLYFIKFDKNESLNTFEIFFFESTFCPHNDAINYVFNFKNRILISTTNSIYELKNPNAESPKDFIFEEASDSVINIIGKKPIITSLNVNDITYYLSQDELIKYETLTSKYQKMYLGNIFDWFFTRLYYYDNFLWINSKDNILVIDTRDFNQVSSKNNKIYLRSVKIDENEEHFVYQSDSVIKQIKNDYLIINKLKTNQSISLTFYNSNYQNSENTYFNYIVESNDSFWEQTEKSNKITLRNLKAGYYNVYIKSVNPYLKETQGIKISFFVKQKFYLTSYAIIIYIVLIILISIYLFVIRGRKIVKRNKYLEDEVKKRTSMLEEQNEEIEAQSKEIVEQKNIVEKELKKIENKLIEHKQLSLVAQKTDNSVLILKKNGGFEWWNRGFTDLFSYKLKKYEKLPLKLKQEKIRPDIYREIKTYTNDKGIISYTTNEVFENDEEIWYQTTIYPIFDELGELFKFVIIDTSISEIKTAEKVILQQKQIIKDLNDIINRINAELNLRNEEHKLLTYYDKMNFNYANFLQQYITSHTEDLKKIFENFFLINMPHSDLSGDFIWSNFDDEKVTIIFGDATGHRVRGAIMSVIGTVVLKEIVIQHRTDLPAKKLSIFNKKLNDILFSLKEFKDNDDIDVALLEINKTKTTMQYSAAKIPLYFIRKESEYILYKYLGERIKIGVPTDKDFSDQEITLKQDDTFYLITDGWVNQFGKYGQQKYSGSRIRDFLISIQNVDLQQQQKLIINEIINWRGNFEQTDDILIFGVKIQLDNE